MARRTARSDGGAEPSAMLRSQHAEATRRAVLDAAKSLFGRQGYAQTSVDEIADAARVTKGAVYHHFAGKEALFRAVYAEVETAAQARVLSAGTAGMAPVDQMVAMMNAYLDAALDMEIRRITLVDGPAIVGQELDDNAGQRPGYTATRAFLATAIARGEIIELDPDALTGLLGGMAWVAGLLIARAGDPDVTRIALGRALDAMLHGLAPHKNPARSDDPA
ncbi:MAG TPA: helix-turn-helix domain-containing protein [Trebonia sp.]